MEILPKISKSTRPDNVEKLLPIIFIFQFDLFSYKIVRGTITALRLRFNQEKAPSFPVQKSVVVFKRIPALVQGTVVKTCQ